MKDVSLVAHVGQLLLHALLVLALAGLQVAELQVVLRGALAPMLDRLQGRFEQAVGHLVPGQ